MASIHKPYKKKLIHKVFVKFIILIIKQYKDTFILIFWESVDLHLFYYSIWKKKSLLNKK